MDKAVIYARVSTEDQDAQNQLDVLKAWASRRGLEVIRVYSDTASAWTAGHQVQLKRLVLDAHHREFDCVLVWALDRITRQGWPAETALQQVDVASFPEVWQAFIDRVVREHARPGH